jgi:hypothetical protein
MKELNAGISSTCRGGVEATMGKSIIEWLREMKPKPLGALPQCRRVELPGYWELPRRFGVVYGCLEDGYVVVERSFKGMRLRYRVVYDVEMWRKIRQIRPELERLRNSHGISQVVANAVYELAERHEVGMEKQCRYGMSGIPLRCEYYVFVDGVRVEAGICRGVASHSECAKLILRRAEEERERLERERRQRLDYYL